MTTIFYTLPLLMGLLFLIILYILEIIFLRKEYTPKEKFDYWITSLMFFIPLMNIFFVVAIVYFTYESLEELMNGE